MVGMRSTFRRVLDEVTPRRVVAVLLLGGFAEPIASLLGWLVSIGWGLKDVATLQAFLLAAIALAVDAGLIYLALRGLGFLLDGWPRREPPTILAEPAIGERDLTVSLEEVDPGCEAASWPPKGGGNGHVG
jgi:hypothetical protein